jgi:hypothetical protein
MKGALRIPNFEILGMKFCSWAPNYQTKVCPSLDFFFVNGIFDVYLEIK